MVGYYGQKCSEYNRKVEQHSCNMQGVSGTFGLQTRRTRDDPKVLIVAL